MAKAKKDLPALRLPDNLKAHRARAQGLAHEEARRRGIAANDDFAILQFYYVFILKYTQERQDRELEAAMTTIRLHWLPKPVDIKLKA